MLTINICKSADNTDYDYICIVFKPFLINTNKTLTNKFITPILNHPGLSDFLFPSNIIEHKQVISDLCKIYELYQQKTEGYELSALSLLCSLYHSIYYILKEQIPNIDCPVLTYFISQKQMLQFIYNNFAQKLSLEEIAHSGGISRTK